MPVAKRLPLITWASHVAKWKDCRACPLCTQRDRIVLARGTVPCDLLFVGEAPGASEDARGLPFDGPAGRVLDCGDNENPGIIQRSVPPGVTYAMTNLVCCFPRDAKMFTDNHEPSYEEIIACRKRLVEFVCIARPKLIVRVGRLATTYANYVGARFIDIVHPAAIARMPLAQKQMAVQKAVVVLRNAIEDMVSLNYPNFTITGDEYAGITSHSYSESEIPF